MHPGRLIALGAALAALGGGAPASDAAHPRHEVWLGFGGAAARERSLFNVPQDIESKPEVAVSLGYMNHLAPRHAVGFHIYGATETTPDVMLVDQSGMGHVARFDLVSFNLGLRYRYTFRRGAVSPYVVAGLSRASGSIESGQTGELTYSGFSACGGPGVGFAVGRSFMVGAEALGSIGTANWKSRPFENSTGKEVDPSLLSGTVNFTYLWGAKD